MSRLAAAEFSPTFGAASVSSPSQVMVTKKRPPLAAIVPEAFADRLAIAVVVVAGLLRLFQITLSGLFLDERYTLAAARLDWITVLGLRGAYEDHPPLYFALVKVVCLGGSAILPARLLSWAAGTVTVVLTYLVLRRVIGSQMALIGELALALAPVHIAYSHIARQYALVTLLVVASYLLLLHYLDSGSRKWLVGYFLVAAIGLWTDYSFLYAFLPQVVLIAWRWGASRQRAIAALAGWVAAGVVFIPWLPALHRTLGAVGQREYLVLSLNSVREVALSTTGFGQTYYYGAWATPWHLWPILQGVYVILAILVLVFGLIELWRKEPNGMFVAVCLFGGTVIVSAVISLVTPAFGERVLIPASVGWAALVGGVAMSRELRWVAPVLVVLVLSLNLVTDWALITGGLSSGEVNNAVLSVR